MSLAKEVGHGTQKTATQTGGRGGRWTFPASADSAFLQVGGSRGEAVSHPIHERGQDDLRRRTQGDLPGVPAPFIFVGIENEQPDGNPVDGTPLAVDVLAPDLPRRVDPRPATPLAIPTRGCDRRQRPSRFLRILPRKISGYFLLSGWTIGYCRDILSME